MYVSLKEEVLTFDKIQLSNFLTLTSTGVSLLISFPNYFTIPLFSKNSE